MKHTRYSRNLRTLGITGISGEVQSRQAVEFTHEIHFYGQEAR